MLTTKFKAAKRLTEADALATAAAIATAQPGIRVMVWSQIATNALPNSTAFFNVPQPL
jgi:hypothetical protein